MCLKEWKRIDWVQLARFLNFKTEDTLVAEFGDNNLVVRKIWSSLRIFACSRYN